MPTWYLLLWGLVFLLAILTRSLVAYVAMLLVWGLGVYFATSIVAIEVVRLGIIGVFVLGVGYTAIEMIANVKQF